MKSPWKYLADLVSPRQAGKEPESLSETKVSNPTELLVSRKGLEKPEDPIEAKTATGDTSHEPVSTESTFVAIEIVDEMGKNSRPNQDRVATPAERSPGARSRQRRARKKAAEPVGMADPVGAPKTSAVPRVPTLSDAVAALDEEVRQLRRQLTEKLRLQNSLLDRLLKRFDPS
ncbi:hypothetical protein [Ensifer sp. SL37]|uniref:hypothetical protein n=1 Tax=Ensifer sp. SL37 TaxID=2995137 RepID=UPI002273A638|nr:hypothetical protein [Ensifer sp. SL37]MCY1740779.1 hypothetical protein [Ensifer sp. SL37]